MKTQQEGILNSDLDDPKKKKNPEPGKQKPLTVEKEHVVEDPKKDKKVRIISEEGNESKNDSNQNSSESNDNGNSGVNSNNTIV